MATTSECCCEAPAAAAWAVAPVSASDARERVASRRCVLTERLAPSAAAAAAGSSRQAAMALHTCH
jgi:hypothetical protein